MRRSRLMVSGMVRMIGIPRAAHTMARAIPVLPLVGSTMMVSSVMAPAAIAASTIEAPMRSFTLEPGLKNSSLATTSATTSSAIGRTRTRGVLPISSVMSLAICMRRVCRIGSPSTTPTPRQDHPSPSRGCQTQPRRSSPEC